MKFYLYTPNNFDNYLPLLLYKKSIENIVKNNIQRDIKLINENDQINYDNETIFITFSIHLTKNIFNILSEKKLKCIIINTESIYNFQVNEILNIINNSNNSNFYIFEYNCINIKYIQTNLQNIKYYYLPLLYNNYLIEYYNNIIHNRIEFKNKFYDILFYGSPNHRRDNIIDHLSIKYNVFYVKGIGNSEHNNSELTKLIENSKIVLNVYYYEHNFIFDYYRLAYLIANKAFIINEYPRDIDFSIDTNLIDVDKYTVSVEYSKIIETVDKYMEIYKSDPDQIEQIKKTQLEWFSKYKMEDEFIKIYDDMIRINDSH